MPMSLALFLVFVLITYILHLHRRIAFLTGYSKQKAKLSKKYITLLVNHGLGHEAEKILIEELDKYEL